MRPDQPQQTDALWLVARRSLRAADMLWSYMRVGDHEDVEECLQTIEAIPGMLEALKRVDRHSRTRRRRKTFVLEEAQGAGITIEDGGQDNPVLWRDILAFSSAAGHDIAYLPLLGLREMVNQPTLPNVDTDLTGVERDQIKGNVSFRWYRHDTSTGDLFGRILPRALHMNREAVERELDAEDRFFSWRHTSRQQSKYVFRRGTHDAADVRLVEISNGGMELTVSALSHREARSVLERLVATLAVVAPDVPKDGIRTFVEFELSEEVLRTF